MTHVLIVDDLEENRTFLKMLLEANGYRVTAVGDGLEALAAARRDPPDAIVSDVLMPKMDGFALCRAWIQDAALRPIPFIFYSATYVRPDDEQFATALGAVRYLIKPLEAEVFLKELRTVLQQWVGRAAPDPASPLDDLTAHALHESALARKLEDKIEQLEAANRKLQRSEVHFRAIAANTPDIFLVQDRNLSKELIINPHLGPIEMDVIHRTVEDIIGKEDAEKFTAITRKVLETGEPAHLETSFQNFKGQTEFFEGVYIPRFDSTGKIDGLIGYLRNVTERKHAEEEIRSLARFPSENPNPMLRVSADGVLLYANESSRPMLTEWACAVGQAVPPWWRTLVAEALGTNSRKKVDVEFGQQTFAFTVAPIAEGEYVNLYGRDITDRKLAMDALQQSERRYHHLFDNMKEGFAHCRVIFEDDRPVDVVYIDVNPAFERLTGLKNVVGRTLTEAIPGIHESNPEVFEGYGRVALTGKPESFEVYVPSIGIWFLISAFCPELGYFVAVFENITERKRAEQALQTTLAEKEVLLREIHHRVKNTLQMTSALLELQSGYVKDEQALAYFKDSRQRIQSMAMVHAQLYHSQSLAQIDFTAYLRTLVDNLRGQYAEQCKQVNIRVAAQACILPVDTAIPCGLVITELVSNAMKHAFPKERAGELRIGLQTVEVGKVVLEVADDGVGLPPGLDTTNSQSFGLRLIRLMVEDQLDGKLTIESNRGTRVVCEIGEHK